MENSRFEQSIIDDRSRFVKGFDASRRTIHRDSSRWIERAQSVERGLTRGGVVALHRNPVFACRFTCSPHCSQHIREIDVRLIQFRREFYDFLEFYDSFLIRAREGEHESVAVPRFYVGRIA